MSFSYTWVIFFSQNVQVKIDVDFERYDNGPQKNNKQGDWCCSVLNIQGGQIRLYFLMQKIILKINFFYSSSNPIFHHLGRFIWYHSIGMGLLFPYIPKKVQTSHVWRQKWRHKGRPTSKIANIQKYTVNIGKLNFPPKKLQISEFHRVFWLIKEGNDYPNIHSKFEDHTSNIFFQNGDFKFFRGVPN